LLSHGLEIQDAVAEAQDYTWQALSSAFRPGMGRMLPDRFFWARKAAAEAAEAAAASLDAETDE